MTGSQLNQAGAVADFVIPMQLPGPSALLGAFWFPTQDNDPNDNWTAANLRDLDHVSLFFGDDPLVGTKVLHLMIVPKGVVPTSREYRFAIEIRFARLDAACDAAPEPAYRFDISGGSSPLGNQPYSIDSAIDPDGIMSYAQAWDGGNVTNYVVGALFIRPLTGDTTRVVDVSVPVTHIHNFGTYGDGCTSVVQASPFVRLTEVCRSNRTETLIMKTNTQYRIEANAQVYSANAGGANIDYRSRMRFQLPN